MMMDRGVCTSIVEKGRGLDFYMCLITVVLYLSSFPPLIGIEFIVISPLCTTIYTAVFFTKEL